LLVVIQVATNVRFGVESGRSRGDDATSAFADFSVISIYQAA
jgi:hypothetical protein